MVNSIPLAPPAPIGPVPRVAAMKSKRTSSAFKWASWLSPKITPGRHRRQIDSGDDDGTGVSTRSSPSHQRGHLRRGASFDNTPGASGAGKLNVERGGQMYFGKHGASLDSQGDISPLAMSRSRDEAFENNGRGRAVGGGGSSYHQSAAATSNSRSLLTAFLLHLNTLLPEYCDHLANASDTVNSINSASKAVSVLERGATTLSTTFNASSSPQMPSPTLMKAGRSSLTLSAIGKEATSTSAPTSPNTSPRKNYLVAPLSDNAAVSPTKLTVVAHWLSPLSPRSSISHDPNERNLRKRSGTKWNKKAEAEWERFVSPLFMLVGAECLYGRMEHVLDPAVVHAKRGGRGESPNNKSSTGESSKESSSYFVNFATARLVKGETSGSIEEDNIPTSEHDAHPASDKRGSRRLIAMYRQIREDLVIVGEYLCDPVLGARVSGERGGTSNGLTPPSLPLPPLVLDSGPSATQSQSKSDKRKKSSGDVSHDLNDISNQTPHQKREFAAISLRNTLDALICFIDARCVMTRIHADLCWSMPQNHISNTETEGSCFSSQQNNQSISGARGRKWDKLAEQCQSVLDPVSCWAKEDDHMSRLAVLNVEKELKALQLALSSAHYLFECNLFNCVMNVRKLHVLLGTCCNLQTCLTLLYIRSALPELLGLMHIYFADASSSLEMLRKLPAQPCGVTTNRPTANQVEEIRAKSSLGAFKSIDMNSLIAEFVDKHASGESLAVIIARKESRDILKHAQQDGGIEEQGQDQPTSWVPIYVKSNLRDVKAIGAHEENHDSIFKRRNQGQNFVRMIRENFSIDNESVDKMNDSQKNDANQANREVARTATWPFNEWGQIEKLQTKHSSTKLTTYPSSYSIGLSRCHISSITDSICLSLIQSVSHAKRNRARASDDEIQQFIQDIVLKLCPDSILGINDVLHIKSSVLKMDEKISNHPKIEQRTTSLWSDSGWSDMQRKKVLHSLGLRQKNSPVMAPLKSPYVKRQLKSGKRRKKKPQNPLNHDHLDLFLGPELAQLL